ncbi:MAG: transporter [Flavobacteriaceae bacterium]
MTVEITNGQDIEPRRWGNLPLGNQVIGAGYAYSYGDVLFDPVLDIEDVEVDVHSVLATAVIPLKLGNMAGRLDAIIPFNFAHWQGLLSGVSAETSRRGLADPRVRISLHLTGPPASNRQELMQYLSEHSKYTTIGVSLGISIPLGQYNADRLLNLGLNQFIFRPQIGMMHNWGLWSYELTASVLIFTANNDFFNDGERKQDPLFAAQTHIIRRFPSRTWLSLSAAYGLGGQSVVNRLPNNDVRSNLLAALSFGFPLGKNQAAKIVYLRSETLKELGADTNSLILAWSIAF